MTEGPSFPQLGHIVSFKQAPFCADFCHFSYENLNSVFILVLGCVEYDRLHTVFI